MASPAGFHLNAKQVEATELLSGPQRHTLLVGGARSSKTFTLVRAILIRAFKAPSRHVIFRLRYNAVRRSVWLDTLPKVMRLCFPGVRAIFHDQDGYLQLPSRKAGEPSEVWVAGLDDKDRVERILGMEFSSLMFNECSQIPYSSVVMALTRLSQKVDGLQNRAYYDLNPVGKGHYSHQIFIEKKSPDSLQRLPDPDNYKYLFMNPKDNAENIDPEYIKTLESLPARARARFLEGMYIDQYQGQLWSLEKIDEGRIDDPHDAPIMRRTIVGVDPSGASGMFDLRSDEIGIVTCGRAPAPLGWKGDAIGEHGYVLEDNTGLYSPEQWARAACSAYYKHHADCIVAEKNFGGDMVRSTIHACDPNVPVKLVNASHGKVVRAEPIAAIAEQDRIHHVGKFPALEAELTNFTTAGYMGSRSPNRCFVAGTKIQVECGEIPIEEIRAGDKVWTRDGLKRVVAAGPTGRRSVVTLITSDGSQLTGTPDHPVFVYGKGFVPMDALVRSDILEKWRSEENVLNLKGESITDIPTPYTVPVGCISRRIESRETANVSLSCCTALSGSRFMGQSQRATMSTTQTMILSTMLQGIWNALLRKSTPRDTRRSLSLNYLRECRSSRRSGTHHLWGGDGTQSTQKRLGHQRSLNQLSAHFVGRNFGHCSLRSSAPDCAYPARTNQQSGTTCNAGVSSAAECFSRGSIKSDAAVPISVYGSFDAGISTVYNIQVADSPEFFANGILVHNCDAMVWAATELFPEQAAHGLLGLWERQAKEMKDTAPLRPTPENLAAAQKNDDWVNRLTGIAKPVNGKPVMIMRCPACHNEKLTLYSEAFACICGAKGSLALLHSEEVSHGIDVS